MRLLNGKKKRKDKYDEIFLKDIPFQQTHIWLFLYRVMLKLCENKKKKRNYFFNENENCEKLFGKLISVIIMFSDLSNGEGGIRKDSI